MKYSPLDRSSMMPHIVGMTEWQLTVFFCVIGSIAGLLWSIADKLDKIYRIMRDKEDE